MLQTASQDPGYQALGWRGWLDRPWLFVAGTFLYALLTAYAYTDLVALDPYFKATGFYAQYPLFGTVPVAFTVAMVPLLWVPRKFVRASDFCVLYLYYFVFIPSCVLLPYVSRLEAGGQFSNLSILLLAFGALEFRRLLRPFALPTLPAKREPVFAFGTAGLAAAGMLYLLMTESVSFSNLSLFDVYEQRARFLSDFSTTRAIVGYISNWTATALAPILLVYGFHSKRYLFSGLGLLAALFAFSATSFKSHFFVPLTVIGMYFAFRAAGKQLLGLTVLGFGLALLIVSMGWDLSVGTTPVLTWNLQFRFIGNNGFLTAQYFNFFENMPKGFYADTFGRILFEPPYNVPIAQVVGEYFSPIRGNHANANLWADGYGNLGIVGVALSSIEAVLFLWLVDSVTRNRDWHVVSAVLMSVTFALANTAVHSMLTSNGGALLIVLLAAMPLHHAVRSRRLQLLPSQR